MRDFEPLNKRTPSYLTLSPFIHISCMLRSGRFALLTFIRPIRALQIDIIVYVGCSANHRYWSVGLARPLSVGADARLGIISRN